MQKVLRGVENGIVHVHGHWQDPESIVFGASSYADVTRDEAAVSFLKTLVYARTMLLVGFGAGLADPNFNSLRDWMRVALAGSIFPHYRLVLDADVTATQAQHHASEHITVLPYGSTRPQLATFLTSLISGLSGSGMRSLDLDPESIGHGVVRTGMPLPPTRSNSEAVAALGRLAERLAAVRHVAGQADGDVDTTGGTGVLVSDYRRFDNVFAEEIDAVLAANALAAQLSPEMVHRAVTWASRLLAIVDR